MNKSKRIVFCAVIFLAVIIATVFIGARVNEYEDIQTSRREYFLSNVYSSVDNCARVLLDCKDWSSEPDNPDRTISHFDIVIKELNTLDLLFRDGQFLIDNKINYSTIDGFASLVNYISGGVISNGQFISESFLADKTLTDNEINYLIEMGKILEGIANEMMEDDDEIRSLKKLTTDQFNKIFAPFFSRYSFQNFTRGLRN